MYEYTVKRIVIPVVVGSSPISHPRNTEKPAIFKIAGFFFARAVRGGSKQFELTVGAAV